MNDQDMKKIPGMINLLVDFVAEVEQMRDAQLSHHRSTRVRAPAQDQRRLLSAARALENLVDDNIKKILRGKPSFQDRLFGRG